MINKSLFQSVISKYYLKGQIETIKFTVSNNILNLKFQLSTGEMLGEVECKNFPLEDSEFVIYNTEQLIKLINILDSEFKISLEKTHQVYTRLNLTDDNFKLSYFLSDLMLAPKTGKLRDLVFSGAKLELKDHITNLIKAREALPNINHMDVISDGGDVTFIFGDDNNYSNKVEYKIKSITKPEIFKLPFNSDIFKEILVSNKDICKEKSYLSINKEGLLEFIFEPGSDLNSKYYLTRKA